MTFAYRWAEWNVLRHQLTNDEGVSLAASTSDTQAAVDTAFENWLLNNYGAMGSLSYLPRPVMVHQIVWSMAYGWSPSLTGKKKALIVIDGLALDQWLILRDSFGANLQVAEAAAFAWIPTLTAISRQSISPANPRYSFHRPWARPPRKNNIGVDSGRTMAFDGIKLHISSRRKRKTPRHFCRRVNHCREDTGCSALGLVVGVIDDTIHGSAMGSGGLHAQVRYWSQGGHVRNLVESLIDDDFEVHITADHGNVEARGMGKPNVGVVAEQRGERAHVLPDQSIRSRPHSLPEEHLLAIYRAS